MTTQMATRGRKPSPIELKLVRGNPGKRPLNTQARVLRQDEATAADRPTMLLEEAVSYWDYALAHAPRTLIKKLDVYLLAGWANAAARYEHNIRLAAKSDVIPVRGMKLADVPMAHRPIMHNPYSAVARAYLKDMMVLAAELGFTPAARSRIGALEAAGEDDNAWSRLGRA